MACGSLLWSQNIDILRAVLCTTCTTAVVKNVRKVLVGRMDPLVGLHFAVTDDEVQDVSAIISRWPLAPACGPVAVLLARKTSVETKKATDRENNEDSSTTRLPDARCCRHFDPASRLTE